MQILQSFENKAVLETMQILQTCALDQNCT